MGVRNIKKQLAGVEDLLLGEGTQVQERNSGSVPITKINLVGIVDTVEALATLDITKYTTAIVKDLDRGGTFEWSATGTANGGTVFAGVSGYWIRQYDGAVNVKWFGANTSIADNEVPINNAISSLSNGVVYIPSGIYYISNSINMKNSVKLLGDGANLTTLYLSSNVHITSIISASYTVSGNDYIYIEGFTIHGNKTTSSAIGILFNNCHVPSYIKDCTVLNCNGDNIQVSKCSVVSLERVWSNGSLNGHALSIDSCRSINVIGGAYEYCSATTSHIKISNTSNIYYPQSSFHGVHVEGLKENNICGFEIEPSSQYYGTNSVNINGSQVICKQSTPVGNYAITASGTYIAINVNGLSHTGTNGFITGLSATVTKPSSAYNTISYWNYNGNSSNCYSSYNGLIGTTATANSIQTITEYLSGAQPAFSSTYLNVGIPPQPDTNYSVFVSPTNYMGANIYPIAYQADKTTTSFKIYYVNLSTGTPTQLSNATQFSIRVTRLI